MPGYRPRGNASRYPDKQLSAEQAKAQLTMYLYNCRPSTLDRLTVNELVRMYRVPSREIEYMLTIARQKRVEEAR